MLPGDFFVLLTFCITYYVLFLQPLFLGGLLKIIFHSMKPLKRYSLLCELVILISYKDQILRGMGFLGIRARFSTTTILRGFINDYFRQYNIIEKTFTFSQFGPAHTKIMLRVVSHLLNPKFVFFFCCTECVFALLQTIASKKLIG